MDDWQFDIFHVSEQADGHALKYVGYELMQRYDLINKFKVSLVSMVHTNFGKACVISKPKNQTN